ncbi:MAG: 50S ribosomal protein L6 [candidate division Zixibacteria bacterium]|nr:50S ribosomal protein L6 [candidate division Zixibacteria bacterium]
MSRVGKLPVPLPAGVTVEQAGQELTVKGPKGTMVKSFRPEMTISVTDGVVTVARTGETIMQRSLHGLTRSLIRNMVVGVTEGYTKQLEMVGVGYRAEMKGKSLLMYIGYSHPVLVMPPEGVALKFEPKGALITVTGIDKELVGLTADKIRAIRKPEPYKGKGIRYRGEHVRRKAGKTAA